MQRCNVVHTKNPHNSTNKLKFIDGKWHKNWRKPIHQFDEIFNESQKKSTKKSPKLVKILIVHKQNKKNHHDMWTSINTKMALKFEKTHSPISVKFEMIHKKFHTKNHQNWWKYTDWKISAKLDKNPSPITVNISMNQQKFDKKSPKLVKIKWIHQNLHKFCGKWRWAPICCLALPVTQSLTDRPRVSSATHSFEHF